jgi:hypothetical protein
MTALHKNFADVHGLRLAYAEARGGDPIVLASASFRA